MTKYYESTGIEWFDPEELLRSFERRVTGQLLPQNIGWLFEMADRAVHRGEGSEVPVALVHGDLRPDHVHRRGRDWKLIDWGGCRRRPIISDVFSGLRLSARYSHLISTYWRLYSGRLEKNDIDKVFMPYINVYSNMIESISGKEVGLRDIQCHLIIDFLSDCLYFWERAGRLSDIQTIRISNMKDNY